MSKIDFKKLEMRISHDPETFLRTLGYQGEVIGNEFVTGNIHGDPGRSFGINMEKALFNDQNDASRDASGKGWIELIAKMLSVDRKTAARRIIDAMGWDASEFPWEPPVKQKKLGNPIMPVPAGVSVLPYQIGYPLKRGSKLLLVAVYEYRNVSGQLLFNVLRFEEPTEDGVKPAKEIRPLSYFGPDIGWKLKGPNSSHQTTLFGRELLEERPNDPVLLVEGEKTAVAARGLFPSYVVITWLGGVGRLAKADWSALSGRDVVIWSDADDAGQKSIALLQRALGLVNASSLRVVQVFGSMPNKWDLADPCPDGKDLLAMLREAKPLDLSPIKQVLELAYDELPSEWAYIVETDEFYHILTGLCVSSKGFDAMYRHLPEARKGSIRNFFLRDFRDSKLVRRTYVPGNSSEIVVEKGGLRCLNMWRPSGIIPVEGDVTPFVEHLRYITGDNDECNQLANVLAFIIQKPGEKLKFSPIIVGKPGTGKSYVGKVMRALIGLHNSSEIETHMLQGDFNTFMEHVQLVVLEELMARGRHDIVNRLKAKITEPYIQINRKYANVREIRNTANILAFTNHSDALPIDAHDRRYLVTRSDAPAREPAYYKQLWSWTAKSYGAILYWLLNRDLSDFDPNAAPLVTDAKLEMMATGRPVVEAEIVRMIEDREHPFDLDLVEVKRVVLILRDYVREANLTTVRNALKAIGAKNLGQKKAKDQGFDRKVSLWAVRNVEDWEMMSSVAVARVYFERQTSPRTTDDQANMFG